MEFNAGIGGLHAGSPMHFVQLFLLGIIVGIVFTAGDHLLVAPAEAAIGLQPQAAA